MPEGCSLRYAFHIRIPYVMSEKQKKGIRFDSLHILMDGLGDGSIRMMLDDWKWIFSYSGRFKFLIVIYTILGLSGSTLGLVSAVAGKLLIDVVTGHKTEQLWIAALVMAFSAMASMTMNSLNSWIFEKLHVEVTNAIRQEVFDNVMRSDWQSLNRYSNGDMLNRLHGDTDSVSSNAVNWLPNLIISIYTFLATFFVIWHYSKGMSLIALSSAPVMLVLGKYLISKQKEHRSRMMEITSGMYSLESEALYNIDTVKSFGVMGYFQSMLAGLQTEYRNITLSWNLFKIRMNVVMTLISLMVEFAAYGYALYLMWSGKITYGTMMLFLQHRSSLSGAFQGLVAILPSFVTGSVSAHRIRELMALPKEQRNEEELPEEFAEGGITAVFRNVSFSYESGKPVLEDSSFEALPGQITAFVGPSGEGKTTVIRLLLGMIKPASGECCFETSGGEKWNANVQSRMLISYVPQGNTLLSGTIAQNLKLAKPDASDEEMKAALETACAWEFVREMPDGLNSDVYEGGKGLSEGQAQRIAIARALLRGAPVLLLDEAASALDVETERKLLRSIMKKSARQTIILTTHRPTVLSMCDRVCRVVDKRIALLKQEEIDTIVKNF